MHDWLIKLCDHLRSQPALVLVSVISVAGSAPREVGAKLLVSADEPVGTIGGGRLEQLACQRARELLGQAAVVSERSSLALGASLGQCCGGRVELLYERIVRDVQWLPGLGAAAPVDDSWLCRLLNQQGVEHTYRVGPSNADAALSAEVQAQLRNCTTPALINIGRALWYVDPCRVRRPEVWIFGAGHVGRALVRQLQLLRYRIVLVDQREDQLFGNSAPSSGDIEKRLVSDPLADIADIPPTAHVLVMTHSHDLDYELCKQLLQRDRYRFIGLIGSATKSARFRRRLQRRGLDSSLIHCPIAPGLVESRRPESIALAIAMQLTQIEESFAVAKEQHTATSSEADCAEAANEHE
jgi:xanthine dehydrogenase accessory factor